MQRLGQWLSNRAAEGKIEALKASKWTEAKSSVFLLMTCSQRRMWRNWSALRKVWIASANVQVRRLIFISHLCFPGVPDEDAARLSTLMGIPLRRYIGKYLGHYILHSGNNKEVNKELLKRIKNRVEG